ncbi:F-box only protein 6 [Physcomitrium patens]|uniref:F-box domain-containing protein n=1 Tax=Physcomitrium patens TaxID=3218 RepID=A0A2K1KER7_PHYPA|nr:uncharacterized protein LOC112283300 [Physcomitrium patens]XP_024377608.1 uncharacterized protein LOC112283300 [Physcomitrium patens]PNR52273.1 hypothetical protein PHYPA_008647 [Physcomitrium patens]|eukprot:XP_024377607.1 uncharacterized protein LOC112283300 [Physcomitrella patens]
MSWMSISDLANGRTWDSLPSEIQDLVLARLDLTDLYNVVRVCRSFREALFRDSFKQARARLHPLECTLSPSLFCVERNWWHLWGFDWKDHSWRMLPPFTCPIPVPDPDSFRKFPVAGKHGLICANMGRSSEPAKLYIFNPLTGEAQQLPSLNYPRHPVVISLQVTTPGRADFRVIAVGSAAVGNGHLSRKTEVYCSVSRRWEVAGDVPGEFSLNEYQTGVFCETQNLLLCTGFMVDGRKGILAFDVVTSEWRARWVCPFLSLHLRSPSSRVIDQLVECNGVIYLFSEQVTDFSMPMSAFSEQESPRCVTHCIDKLNLWSEEGYTWTRRLTKQLSARKSEDPSEHPKFTCVPVGKHNLCIFNTDELTGKVYDMSKETVDISHNESLPTPPLLRRSAMNCLNLGCYLLGAVLPDLKPDEDVNIAL